MKNKKVWISIAAILVFIAVVFLYFYWRNYSLSPRGTANLTSGGITVKVDYCRPSVRGRVIFGTEDQQALQPYGEYWRLGANEATEITINRDVLFNDTPLKAGTYRMYAIPGPGSFEIALNSELGKWGAGKPDYDLDVLHTKVPVEKITVPVEQFRISLSPVGQGIDMIFEWSDVRFVVPIKVQ